MTPDEQKALTEQLDKLKADISKAASEEVKKLLEAQKEALEMKMNANATKEAVDAINKKMDKLEVDAAANQKALDELIAMGRAHKVQTNKEASFGQQFGEMVEKNFDGIKKTSAGGKFGFEMKVGTMTAAANLTGEVVATFQPGGVTLPAPLINFRDLCGTFQSGTGLYVIYRESGNSGTMGVTSAGAAKNQKDYSLTRVPFTADYINGYARIAKEMLQDLPFMQQMLPRMLLRDFYKAENSIFYSTLSSTATGGAAVTGTNRIEELINQIGRIEDTDYPVNGIVMKPSNITSLQLTKPTQYSQPNAVVVSPTGQLMVNGVPAYKASWAAGTHFTMGDWSQTAIGVVDSLKVEFFEQDGDNVTKNLITVRVEAREMLVTQLPGAFTHKAFVSAQ